MDKAKLSIGAASPKKTRLGEISVTPTYRAGYFNAVENKYHRTMIFSISTDRKEGQNNFSLIDSLIN